MSEVIKKKINVYDVEIFPDGNVKFTETRFSLLYAIGLNLAFLVFMYFTITLNNDLRYITGICALAFLFAGSVTLFLYFSPNVTVISKEKRWITVKRLVGVKVVSADSIRQISYWQDSVSSTMSGIGPKIHLQCLVAELNSGERFEFLHLKANLKNLSRNFDEHKDAEDIMNLIKSKLNVKVIYPN